MISIVIPTLGTRSLAQTLASVVQTNHQIEVILAVPPGVSMTGDTVVSSEQKGRGHQIVSGIHATKGEVMLILHDDTTLPKGWADSIVNILANPAISGGGFALTFDRSTLWLRFLERLSRFWFHLTGEFWGDRGMFFRKNDILPYSEEIDIPIMEDVRLSKRLRRLGSTVLLPENVVTSAGSFDRRGIFLQVLRIVRCRTAYALGISPNLIHSWYQKDV